MCIFLYCLVGGCLVAWLEEPSGTASHDQSFIVRVLTKIFTLMTVYKLYRYNTLSSFIGTHIILVTGVVVMRFAHNYNYTV